MLKFCKHIQYVKELKSLQEEAVLAGATAVGISKQGNMYVYDQERKAAKQVSLSRAAELLNVSVATLEEKIQKVDDAEETMTLPVTLSAEKETDIVQFDKGAVCEEFSEIYHSFNELADRMEKLIKKMGG